MPRAEFGGAPQLVKQCLHVVFVVDTHFTDDLRQPVQRTFVAREELPPPFFGR